MTVERKIEILAVALIVAATFLIARVWIEQHDANLRAETSAKAQSAIIAARAADIATRDAGATQVAATLNAQAAKIQTVPQATRVILQYLPAPAATAATPAAPPTLTTITRDELTPVAQAALPAAPSSTSYTLFTAPQLQAVARQDLACAAGETLLTACQQDKVDAAAQLAAAQKEAATWKAAAQGGSKWQRFGRTVKLVACAGAGGFAGSYVHKSSPGPGSAIGAAAGVTACSLF